MQFNMLKAHMDDDGHVGGVHYKVQGELTPVLLMTLDEGASVYYEHHVVLSKEPSLKLQRLPLKGTWKRLIGGLPLVMISAFGPGHIAFSRESPGHVFALHLKKGKSILCPEHTLMAATGDMKYDFEYVTGFWRNQVAGGNGIWIDTFTAQAEEGAVWLHGHGNVFEYVLDVGEQIDVEPGAWIYRDPTVKMTSVYQDLKMGFFSSANGNFYFNRFTGPGRVGVQTGAWMPVGV
jgi:uncharacterized protein (AIM24 family)